jgi:hypothetical protein
LPHLIRDVTEADMVLEFLRAEIDSPRFGSRYMRTLFDLKKSRTTIIDNADSSNQSENELRRFVLGVRGYPARERLFAEFPRDVTWQHQRFSPQEVRRLLYARVASWIVLSAGSRLAVDGALNANSQSIELLADAFSLSDAGRANLRSSAEHIVSVATGYAHGIPRPMPIAVQHESRFVILEGHVRTTGYVLSGTECPLDVLVGRADDFGPWERRLLS